jgi:hypothetical protein
MNSECKQEKKKKRKRKRQTVKREKCVKQENQQLIIQFSVTTVSEDL